MNKKICVNCKHHLYKDSNNLCTREEKINIINGEFYGKNLLCTVEREDALRLEKSRCGIKAKFYDKLTWVDFIKVKV